MEQSENTMESGPGREEAEVHSPDHLAETEVKETEVEEVETEVQDTPNDPETQTEITAPPEQTEESN